MKRKMFSSVLAITAAVSLFTGCSPFPISSNYSPDDLPDYSFDYSNEYFDTSSTYSDDIYSSSIDFTDFDTETSSDYSPSYSSVGNLPAPDYISSSSAPAFTPKPVISSQPAYTSSSRVPAQPAPSNETPYRVKVLDTASEEFVAYTTGTSELSFSSYYTPYLFDFRTKMAVGYSLNQTDDLIAVEADYGLKGEFNGSILYFQIYNHTNGKVYAKDTYMEALDITTNKKINWPCSSAVEKCEAKNLPNGLYCISTMFTNNTTAKLYFLVNGNEYQFCQMALANTRSSDSNYNIDKIRARRAHLKELIKEWKITPENSLSVDIIKYPSVDYYWNGKLHWRCDTDLWADFSDTLVNPEWSDERKAFAICDWMSQNLAYDLYVSDVLCSDRAIYYTDSTGKYSVWELKCGVCRDFGQILAIMMRKQGIPAEVIANDTHIWNVIYLNGQWMEVDICYSSTKDVSTADTTVRYNSGNNYHGLLSMVGQNNGTDYGTSIHKYLYMGQSSF